MHKLLGANAPEHRNSVCNAIECANEEIECNIVYEIEKKKRERVSDYETMSWITTEHEQNRRVVYSSMITALNRHHVELFLPFHRTRYSLVLREEQFIKYRCTKKKKEYNREFHFYNTESLGTGIMRENYAFDILFTKTKRDSDTKATCSDYVSR